MVMAGAPQFKTSSPASMEPQQGSAVLLAAHYDSVACRVRSFGRRSRRRRRSRNRARVEIASRAAAPGHFSSQGDGEEARLLGAQAFVDFHPWASEVKAAVNLNADARVRAKPDV